MGNSASSDDSDDDINIEYKEEDAVSDSDFELEKENSQDLDFSSLFDHHSLRAAASKVKDVIPENILQQYSSYLIRWLEERLQRNEEVVTISQFYDVLVNKKVEREDCIKAFQQFDSEGDGSADAGTMLEVLKSSSCSTPAGDLSSVVKTLQACSLTPGFIDVYNEDKHNFGQHGIRILNFLMRNRAPSTALPFPILNGFNNTYNMRKDVLSSQMSKLKETVGNIIQQEESLMGDKEDFKPLSKCWTSLEVSSNKADASNLSNGDFSSYWQSDGSARSHWIRLRIKCNVVIKQLSIAIASGDQSYMPQVVSVSVGKSAHTLKEVKEVRISSHMTGDVVLLENAKLHYPVVQINIRRCHSDGCDCRVHGIKTAGFRIIKEQGVSLLDAAATWYLQVLASTASATLPTVPALRDQILQHSFTALKHMGPLSLSPNSTEKPAFLSQHVLSNMEKFLQDIALSSEGVICKEGLIVLLSFAVARGSVSSMLKTLLYLQKYPTCEICCGPLIKSMILVKDSFWKKQGHSLALTLADSDGGQKDETSGPHNVLTGNWNTAQPYLSGDGNTRVNMFFQSQDYIQLTRIRIKVDKGPRGPKSGMVFVYKDDQPFQLEEHVNKFKGYDVWNSNHYTFCQKMRSMGMAVNYLNPVAYFSTEDERDEVEIPIDVCSIGQYVCIKFLEPRQSCAERLGIVGVKFYGFNRRSVFMEALFLEKASPLPKDEVAVSTRVVVQQVLSFLLGLARDQIPVKKPCPVGRVHYLDMTDVSIEDIWRLYQGLEVQDFYCKNLVLQLLHALFPYLSKGKVCSCSITEAFYAELCKLVDGLDKTKNSQVAKLSNERNAEPGQVLTGAYLLAGKDLTNEKELSFIIQEVGSDVNGGLSDESGRVHLAEQLLKSQLIKALEQNEAPTIEHPDDQNVVLGRVARIVIVDGAAVFFPDKEARRKQLFSMMTDVNSNQESISVMLTFQSLCQFFSSVDPSGLLDLPSTLMSNFDEAPALAVMETLLSVAFQEFKNIMKQNEGNEQLEQLVHLLCSLQTSLLSWCWKIIEEEQHERILAQDILIKYVDLLTEKVLPAMKMLGDVAVNKKLVNWMEKVSNSFVSSVLRQAVQLLIHIGTVLSDQVRMHLCKTFLGVSEHIMSIAVRLPEIFYKCDSEQWKQMNAKEVVLRTWEVESSHNYENNQHSTQMFSCPGASVFNLEFDSKCETEKRYDYLEFTDSRGAKTRFDQKVGTEKWPNQMQFKGGDKLQFLFHSDSSNNEWGYKFKVIAKGCPDVPLCWMFDLHLTLAKMYGVLSGATLSYPQAEKKTSASTDNGEELQKSELWTTLFRAGYRVGKLQRSLSGKHETDVQTMVFNFVLELVNPESALAGRFIAKCEENIHTKQELGGKEISETCRMVFSTLLWHTQTLREDISKFIKADGEYKLSEGIYQAFYTAESVRTYLLEERQKAIMMSEKKGKTVNSSDPVLICKEKAQYLLRFAGLSKVYPKTESKNKPDRRTSKLYRLPSMTSADRVYRVDLAVEKYPSFKLVLNFIRDPAWSQHLVEHLLTVRSQRAKAIVEVYKFMDRFFMIEENMFEVASIAFLQEVFTYQDKVTKHYASGLDGCGLELESAVRKAFYSLAKRLVDALRNTKRFQLNRSSVMCYDYFQACVLHFLDIDWQLYDLQFIDEIKMTEFYMQMAKGSVSVREKIVCEVDEKAELETYQKNMLWLEECKKEFFKWYDKQSKKKEHRHATQMFVAQFCDLLDVEISCDGCGTTLPGCRYRCLRCPDMDLCSPCYAGGVKPGGEHNDDHEIIHLMYKCDECQAFVVGTRIHCEVCEDFDLCLGCQNEGRFPACHTDKHQVTKIPMTKLKLNTETDSSLLSYVYQHVWLSFVSMALKMSSLLQTLTDGIMDQDYVLLATKVHNQCISLASSCLQTIFHSEDGNDASSETVQKRLNEAFALHSQERILGLLGAMLPGKNKVISRQAVYGRGNQCSVVGQDFCTVNYRPSNSLTEDLSLIFTSTEFLTQLLAIARGETGHEENTQHFAMGLIGQLLQKAATSCENVDSVVAVQIHQDGELGESSNKPDGYCAAAFLFSFGASCLERSGLEWANSMAHILQKMFSTSAWRPALQAVMADTIRSVKTKAELSSIFALFVIAGFPEVLSIGSQVKYADFGTETKEGIVLKHFPDKNQTLVVDKKSRKRIMIKDELVDRITHTSQVLDEDHVLDFIELITDRMETIGNGQEKQSGSVESIWVLSLALKALWKSLSRGMSDRLPVLYLPSFVQSIVFLATKGTGFSKQWLLKDLEILCLNLYTKDKDSEVKKTDNMHHGNGNVGGSIFGDRQSESTELVNQTEENAENLQDPWMGLPEPAKLCFHTLEEHLKIPASVLRAIYDIHGQSTEALLMAVHQNNSKPTATALWLERQVSRSTLQNISVDGKTVEANEKIRELTEALSLTQNSKSILSMKWTESAVDMGMQLVKHPDTKQRISDNATEEPSDNVQQLIMTTESDIRKDTTRLSKQKSGVLLKKEQEVQGKTGSFKFLIKANTAVAVLYARQILTSLLAHWPDGEHLITAELLGCKENEHIPFILDLINTSETADMFPKVVQNVIKFCPVNFLIPIATMSCQFMEEMNLSMITKESSHNYENNCKVEDKIRIPGASHLSVKFDARCCTEEACDELTLASSSDYKQDRHVFSGNRDRWHHIEIPGDTVYMKFTSDISNNDWGYKFTVSGGKIGRFDTGYMLLNGVLTVPKVLREFDLKEMWHSLVYVACKQTGKHRLRALQLLLKIMQSNICNTEKLSLDLSLLKPLWTVYQSVSEHTEANCDVIQPINRALTEIFYEAENLAEEWKITPMYIASLQNERDFQLTVFQGLLNIAGLSKSIEYENKATRGLGVLQERIKEGRIQQS